MDAAISNRQVGFPRPLFCFCLVAISVGAAAFAQELQTEYATQPCLEIEGPIEEAVKFVEETYNTKLSGICIKVVSKDEVAEAFNASAGMPDKMPEIGGLFVIAEDTILIPSDLDPNRASDLSFVVHELVHAYQYDAGLLLPEASLGPLECEAYFVQAAFLRSRGLPREALLMSLQGELQMGSVCEY